MLLVPLVDPLDDSSDDVVVERHPREAFEVQCLDDSTDKATRDVVDAGIEYWTAQGIKISAVRRTNRQGYKAGAMHEVRGVRGGGRSARSYSGQGLARKTP